MCEIASDDRKKIESIFWNLLENKDSSVWPDKNFWRALVKLIHDYNWDFHKLWDLTRLRVVEESFSEQLDKFIQFIKIAKENKDQIVNIWIQDNTWHIFSISEKPWWYRDFKALFTLKSWNVVELQFHFQAMYDVKAWNVNLTDKVVNKLELEKSLLDIDEIFLFSEIFNREVWKYPDIEILHKLSKISINEIKNDKRFEKISKIDNFTSNFACDKIYHLRRDTMKSDKKLDKTLNKKLTRLERVIFENAWAEVILKYFNIK